MINFKLASALALGFLFVQERDPDLVLQLSFDDQKIDQGKVVGKVDFVEGRKGLALKVDGAGHVQLMNCDALDKVQAKNYSLAAWFRPDNVPPGTESDNNARYAILVKEGWHSGLSYNNEKQFVMEHWLAPAAGGEDPVWAGAGTWEDSNDAGKWYHLAGVVDRKAGTTKLYVNGELKNSAEWEANKDSRDPGKSPWRVGVASPEAKKWAWPAKGLIDDVRIYKKALSDAEVTAIYKEGVK